MSTDYDLSRHECQRAIAQVRWATRRIQTAERRIRAQRNHAGEVMRELRELAGVTIPELAMHLLTTPARLAEMEDGVTLYAEDMARRAVAFLSRADEFTA